MIHEFGGGFSLDTSGLVTGNSIWKGWISGVSRLGSVFQKNVASAPLLRGATASRNSQRQAANATWS